MESNELRINNWIIEPGQDENKPFQIFSIYHEAGNNKINGLPITYFKPIPLTEEWLIRLPKGFEYPDWIKFVHDLQNWYYYNNNKKELIFDK